MTVYNKLARDRIPEIIKATGKQCRYMLLFDNGEVIDLLEQKLDEEMDEYLENKDVEEIADMAEITLLLGRAPGH